MKHTTRMNTSISFSFTKPSWESFLQDLSLMAVLNAYRKLPANPEIVTLSVASSTKEFELAMGISSKIAQRRIIRKLLEMEQHIIRFEDAYPSGISELVLNAKLLKALKFPTAFVQRAKHCLLSAHSFESTATLALQLCEIDDTISVARLFRLSKRVKVENSNKGLQLPNRSVAEQDTNVGRSRRHRSTNQERELQHPTTPATQKCESLDANESEDYVHQDSKPLSFSPTTICNDATPDNHRNRTSLKLSIATKQQFDISGSQNSLGESFVDDQLTATCQELRFLMQSVQSLKHSNGRPDFPSELDRAAREICVEQSCMNLKQLALTIRSYALTDLPISHGDLVSLRHLLGQAGPLLDNANQVMKV